MAANLSFPLVFGTSGMDQTTADGLYANLYDNQTSSPTAGQTVVMTDNARDGLLTLTPAGTLATLTITLPSNANSRIGQERCIATTQAVTALTINGASTILGAPASLLLGDLYKFQKTAANTWMLQQ